MKRTIEPNTIFNRLTTIKDVGRSDNGSVLWLCQCSCGKEVIVPTSRLKNGRSKSCGCYRGRRQNHLWQGYGDISATLLSNIRWRANKRGLEFDLDCLFLHELYLKQDKRCAITNMPITIDKNASIDRRDNEQGYIKTNVWWVHKDINKMKMDFDLEYFKNLCFLITQNNKSNE